MILEILTPEAIVFKGQVDAVTLPGLNGNFQLLTGHSEIISALKPGTVRFNSGEANLAENQFLTPDSSHANSYLFSIQGGVVELLENKIVLLAEV